MSFLERRPLGWYGLPVRNPPSGNSSGRGVCSAWWKLAFSLNSSSVFGGYSFGSLALHGPEIDAWAVLWALCLLFVGFFEEFLFRGYAVHADSGIGFWPSAIVLSLVFAAVHFQNSGEGSYRCFRRFCSGHAVVLPVRRTGSLWFAVGMHAAFDFGETFLYSVPDSGMLLPGHLSNATMAGTGMAYRRSRGPEGSVFDFLLLFIFFYVIHRLYPPTRPSQPNPTNSLFHQFRRKHQLHALTPRLRQRFLQRFQRGAVRVSDGDRFAFSCRSGDRRLNLFPHRRHFFDIVKKRHVAKTSAHS